MSDRVVQMTCTQQVSMVFQEPGRSCIEAEAILLRLLGEAGSIQAAAQRLAPGRLPVRMLARLEELGLCGVGETGVVELHPRVSEHVNHPALLDVLRSFQSGPRVEAVWLKEHATGRALSARALDHLDTGDRPELLGIEFEGPEAAVLDALEDAPDLEERDLIAACRPFLNRNLPSNRFRVVTTQPGEPVTLRAVLRKEESERGERWRMVENASREIERVIETAQPELLGLEPRRELERLDPAPELIALRAIRDFGRTLRKYRKKKAPDDFLLAAFGRLKQAINQAGAAAHGDDTLRAESARVVVGPDADFRRAAGQILARSRQRALVLSSFLAIEHAPDVGAWLDDALPSAVRLLALYGRTDDRDLDDASERCADYSAALGVERIDVLPTAARTHAKVVLNDAGDVWIGSWNALSSTPGSERTESGIWLHGHAVCRQVLRVVRRWMPESECGRLEGFDGEETAPDWSPVEIPIAFGSLDYALGDGFLSWVDAERTLRRLEALYRARTRRPVVHLVRTHQHRSAVLDLVEQSSKRLILASDRVKPAGLDPQLMRAVAGIKGQSVSVVWGREDPREPMPGDDRRAATAQLRALMAACRDARRGPRLHTSLDRPMMSHAKLVVVDDERLLVTSDNLLVYGNQRRRDEGGELGVVVDAPVEATLMRGELELTHGELRESPKDNTRWVAGLATAVRDACVGGRESVPAGEAIAAMIGRCRPENNLFADLEGAVGLNSRPPVKAFLFLILGAVRRGLVVCDEPELERLLRIRRPRDLDLDTLMLRPGRIAGGRDVEE